jgi:hypothetical protein
MQLLTASIFGHAGRMSLTFSSLSSTFLIILDLTTTNDIFLRQVTTRDIQTIANEWSI